MIRTAGRGPDSRANGSFPKGARRLSEKLPGAHPPPHQPSPGGSASATPPQGGSDRPGSAIGYRKPARMDQRMLFIVDYLSGRYTKKGLCRHYGISRPTGDKWIDRYRIHGPEGLDETRLPSRHDGTGDPDLRRSWLPKWIDFVPWIWPADSQDPQVGAGTRQRPGPKETPMAPFPTTTAASSCAGP